MHALLRRGPRSLRAAVVRFTEQNPNLSPYHPNPNPNPNPSNPTNPHQVRFVRLLLMEQPQCATCVVSHQLLPPMLEMLLERGGACDNLVNSAEP